MEDFYDLLDVAEDASTEEIDRAWRTKARTYHPDVNDDARANAQFKTLKTAHEVLIDESERAVYNGMGHAAYVRRRLDGLPTAGPTGTAAGETGDSQSVGPDATRTPDDRSDDPDRGAGDDEPADRGPSEAESVTDDPGGGSRVGTGRRRRASVAASQRRRSPLRYGWVGALLAGVIYLPGLVSYLRANAPALARLREMATATPIAALTGSFELLSPHAYVLQTASADAPLSLLFPVGAGALALVFAATVVSFGRGSAYLYLLGGGAPLAGLGIGAVVTLPDGIALALVAVFPLLATVAFLVDVGSVLVTGR
jgi:hypothetical protein